MTCPYLWGTYLRSCSASRDVYVPSTFELAEYCAPDRYDRFSTCPLYRMSESIRRWNELTADRGLSQSAQGGLPADDKFEDERS